MQYSLLDWINKLLEIISTHGVAVAAVISGIIALVVTILSPLGNWLVSRSGALRDIRSRYRMQWIDAFRNETSELLAIVQALEANLLPGNETPTKMLRRKELIYRLKMRLNLNEVLHQEFDKAIDGLSLNVTGLTSADLQRRRDKVVSATQALLKPEWNKVRDGN